MTEQELLLDCLRRLNGAEVTYFLTGSMASNYWGIPRTTHDLDFVIQLPPAAVGKLVHAFSSHYFLDEAAVRSAYQPPYQFNAIEVADAINNSLCHHEPRFCLLGTTFGQEQIEGHRD